MANKVYGNGSAQGVTTQDFNARMKLMLAGKSDPQPKPKRDTNPRAFKSSFAKTKV